MIELAPELIAVEAHAEAIAHGGGGRPERAIIDSREARDGDLFFGLRGAHADGGRFAAGVVEAGAWGVVVGTEHAQAAAEAGEAWVFATDDPLRSMQQIARAWRRELACPVVGITGSTGKTSVKDIARALLPQRVHASPENFNTEVGLPLAILSAPPETEVLVLEMAMRGLGQIAELCEISEPNVAAITNIGPVHLELLGTLEAIAEAKAEILEGLSEGDRAVVPVDAEALDPHLSETLDAITFGPGGDVSSHGAELDAGGLRAQITTPDGDAQFAFPFTEEHNLRNALCAVAIGVALEADPAEMARRAPGIEFSRLRGELIRLSEGIVVVNDCYNANPISMHAALEHLAGGVGGAASGTRRVAVLGDMRELGRESAGYHREIGAHARGLGIGPVVGVGELARDYAPDEWAPDAEGAVEIVDALLEPGDAVLVKGSRSVGLERLTESLVARRGA